MFAGFTIARIRGIPIKADFSLLLIGIIFFVLPAFSVPTPFRAGAVVESIFLMFAIFASILLHELGHAFMALREKMQIHGITLWALGGFAQISGGRPAPGPHFKVAAAGPAVTAGLAVLLPLVAGGIPGADGPPPNLASVVDRVGALQIWLLAFNLLPAYPLDGGRMFHAALWAFRGNLTWASSVAGSVGRAFGALLIGLGAVSYLTPGLAAQLPAVLRISPFFALLLGFMIYSGAKHPPVVPVLRDAEGMVIGDFMVRDFVVCDPEMRISKLMEAFGRLQTRPTALVLSDGAPVGMITRSAAKDVSEQLRETTTVSDVMVPREQIRTVQADDPLATAKKAIEDGPDTAVVLHNDAVVGLVSVSDVARAIVAEEPGPAA